MGARVLFGISAAKCDFVDETGFGTVVDKAGSTIS